MQNRNIQEKSMVLGRELKENLLPQVQSILPEHIPASRFIRVVKTAVLNNPYLLELDRISLYQSAIKAAEQGMYPDGEEAALVPFKGRVAFMPMVGGILKRIRNSGKVGSITAQLIYAKEHFKYSVDHKGEHVEFNPDILAENRGYIRGAIAMAALLDGGYQLEIMSIAQLDAIKKFALAKNKNVEASVWNKHPEEMYRKTVIKRLAKRLPKSTDLDLTPGEDRSWEGEPEGAEITHHEVVEPEQAKIEEKDSIDKELEEVIN